MRTRNPHWIVAAFFVALGVMMCNEVTAQEADASSQSDTTSLAELEALYQERVERSRTHFTQADVDFMIGMIGHHAQALVMSALAPTNGASPQVQTLAARITNAQQDEIETMQKWLRDRDQPVPEVHIDGLNLTIQGAGDHNHHAMNMPGMLTQEQLEELAAAQNKAFDRLFLDYMIQHHSGAVVMVDELFATDGAAQDAAAFKLASDIHADQTTEIARMERMLEALSGANQDS